MKAICVLPGDGIGPEVVACAVKVLEAVTDDIEFVHADIGSEAFAKTPSKLRAGSVSSRKFCCRTSHPEYLRAMATSSPQPSSPVGASPSARRAARSRPGPQPKSKIRRGAVPSKAPSNAA